MRLFFALARKYPWRTILTLTAILFSGIAEGFGISALLPILNTIFNQNAQASGRAGSGSAGLGLRAVGPAGCTGDHGMLGVRRAAAGRGAILS